MLDTQGAEGDGVLYCYITGSNVHEGSSSSPLAAHPEPKRQAVNFLVPELRASDPLIVLKNLKTTSRLNPLAAVWLQLFMAR